MQRVAVSHSESASLPLSVARRGCRRPLRVRAAGRGAGGPGAGSSGASGTGAGGAGGFDDLLRSSSRKLNDWAREQRVQERLEQLQQNATNTFTRLDAEYDLRKKAAAAADAAQARAAEIESKTGVWRRLRLLWSDFVRTWPARRRQLGDFINTPLGGVALFVLFILLLQSGLFFRLVSWFFLLSWLAPLLLLPLMQRQQEQMMARMREQAMEEERRRRNPFAGGMNDMFSAFGRQQRQQQQQRGGRSQQQGNKQASDGPVIDVSWEEVE